MKIKLAILLTLLFVAVTTAQQAINYKVLIKDDLGNVLSSQAVTIQFTILEGAGATTVYQEDHTVNTDANGIAIVNIGTGTILNGDYNTIDWGSDDHFLNVQIDSGSGLVDLGTTQFMAVPYALYAEASGSSGTIPSGLEALDEGSGQGWRLIGTNPANYGNIANRAVDLSYSNVASDIYGATGGSSTAFGEQTTASGQTSTAFGRETIASGIYSTAFGRETIASGTHSIAFGFFTSATGQTSTTLGYDTTASGESSFASGASSSAAGYSSSAFNGSSEANGDYSATFGFFTQADALSSFAIGGNNIGGGSPDTWVETDPLFEVGNSNLDGVNNRSNALTVLKNGTITAPSFDISEITEPKALITKEYFEANSSAATGLEALDEGNGIGWRLIGAGTGYFGDIGNHAVDMSYSVNLQNEGATGFSSFCFGFEAEASGSHSVSLGYFNVANGDNSLSLGKNTLASGDNSAALGQETIADDINSTVIGKFNNNTASSSSLFQVGNGTSINSRSNAFNINTDGTITAPSFDISEITDPKALITKEYADANYSGGSGTSPTGLEALDEGNGTGWRLIGRDPANYDNIGENAVDLSINPDNALNLGATGTANFTAGYKTKASNLASTALGNFTTASGFSSTAMGFETIADDQFSTVVGRLNDNTTSTNMLFQVGNGTSGGRSNAFSVNMDGIITAPSLDISEITDPKALITKEYADANYSGGSGTSPTGLEALDEGNGIGWRLVGSDPNNFGNIGANAIDLSLSQNPSTVNGATAPFSFALGNNAEASGFASMAIGFNSKAQNSGSIAIGGLSTGTGAVAIAGGNASGENSISIGNNSEATTSYAVALGYGANTSGQYAVAVGHNTSSSGWNSFSSGVNTEASGTQATAMGAGTIASGNSSVALGEGTRAEAPNTTAIGLYNVGGGDPLLASETDPLFEIGNGKYVDGTNDVRTNALTVLRNGNATLAGTLTQNSDKRLKTNIEDLPYGLNEILEMTPVFYNWKRYPEKRKSLGLIAQEVEPIINEIVHQAEDDDKTLSVSYIELIPVLIKAIQEQQAIIEQQAQTIKNQETASVEQDEVLQTLLQRVEALEKQSVKTSKVELVKN